jgi:hypothetical protein
MMFTVKRVEPFPADCSICAQKDEPTFGATCIATTGDDADEIFFCCDVCYEEAEKDGFDDLLESSADELQGRAKWLRSLIGKLKVETADVKE